jgi:hypothetical protein
VRWVSDEPRWPDAIEVPRVLEFATGSKKMPYLRRSVVRSFMLLASLVVLVAAPDSTAAKKGKPTWTTYDGGTAFVVLRVKAFPSGASSYWEERVEGVTDGSLVETSSNFGYSYGAEVEIYSHELFLRGGYQKGAHAFADHGEANTSTVGFDIGQLSHRYSWVGGLFFGYRRITVHRSYEETLSVGNRDLQYGESIFGTLVKSPLDKTGFLYAFEVALSIRGFVEMFRTDGVSEHGGAQLSLEVGRRLKATPITVTIGGEIQVYQFEYELPVVPYPRFSDFSAEERIDAPYGLTLKVSYEYGRYSSSHFRAPEL